ncbi:MAG: type II toxin-antitoxin system RelE/ParE family toxin [Bacteroidales bacterium]|nr:type II toxin-antitoxin system RelE/ParE family toxin [Bacteroidales bacterium]
MKIIWSDFASKTLIEIYKYHKEVASKSIAHKIKTNIFSSTRQLLKYPQSGQIEKTLEEINEGHRYLVSGNYKIVYKKVIEGILITDIFDTRQYPIKINDPTRKSSK